MVYHRFNSDVIAVDQGLMEAFFIFEHHAYQQGLHFGNMFFEQTVEIGAREILLPRPDHS